MISDQTILAWLREEYGDESPVSVERLETDGANFIVDYEWSDLLSTLVRDRGTFDADVRDALQSGATLGLLDLICVDASALPEFKPGNAVEALHYLRTHHAGILKALRDKRVFEAAKANERRRVAKWMR